MVRVLNVTRDACLGEKVERASSFLARLRGLLGRRGLAPGQGLILEPEQSIHSFFMRFAFDAVFVDKNGHIVHLIERMPPYRFGPFIRRSRLVVELPAGTIAATKTTLGDELAFEE
mgnify:CR=1 FL=1